MTYKMKGFSGFGNSPAKQEGPIDKKNPKLQKGEMKGTWVYPGGNKSERMNDLEDRIEFLTTDIRDWPGGERGNVEDMKKARKKLKQELDIMMKRKGSGIKK